MPLQKQALDISFAQGLDLKSDPFRVAAGKFLSLQNTIFAKGGLLQKRNGFEKLTALPDSTSTSVMSYESSLIAAGNAFYTYSTGAGIWFNKGSFQQMALSVIPAVRSATSQTTVDVAISPISEMACVVWLDSDGAYYYQIVDSATGNILLSKTALPATSSSTPPRVFLLGNYFVILFIQVVTATPHLQFIAVPTNQPTNPSAATDISTTIAAASSIFSGAVTNNTLYISYQGTGSTLKSTFIDSTLDQHNTVTKSSVAADNITVAADSSNNNIWVTYYTSGTSTVAAVLYDQSLNVILSGTTLLNGTAPTINEMTSVALNGTMTLFYQVQNTYGYSPAAPGSNRSDYIQTLTCTSGGSVSAASTVIRSVGLASKAFYLNSKVYMLTAFNGPFQPTYFLIDSSGNIIAKLAYGNGGGYPSTKILPGAAISGSAVKIGYLFKDLVEAVNRNQGVPNISGVYSQTGINIATFDFEPAGSIINSELGKDLHLAGGYITMYDGNAPVEHGYHIYPENLAAAWSASGGSIAAKPDGATNTNAYFYQVTYEWTDAQGNIHRSSPSIPLAVTTTGAGTSGSITVNVPTLRLTSKTGVKICVYRWSVAQQVYYLIGSIVSQTANDKTTDSVAIVDTSADATILGNAILYTTGGVVENIAAPAASAIIPFKGRLFLIDSEDDNLLWFSKQVIEAVPVEMSDLFTIFVPPTLGAQGSTGGMKALGAMDDKLIIFKQDAAYYITGTGPDNTGANNDFSDPTFIAGTVGCSNQQSIVFMPGGLMFESDKGIWLLGRDLSTSYVGAPVESLTQGATVLSAINVPGTNQVRFTLDSGVTLMYDYYYDQWTTFVGAPAISSTIFQNLHTYINSGGQVYQEAPGTYVDGASPVLMQFTTAWIKLAGLQGYQRAYFYYLLGTYYSPHKLVMSIAYDYNPSASQIEVFTPDNQNPAYGGDPIYGNGTPYGGSSNAEKERVFFETQKCESFQLTFQEIFDPSQGIAPGAGFTLSGLNLVVGIKKAYRTQAANKSV